MFFQRNMHGKWGQEIKDLDIIQRKINQYKAQTDIASNFTSPSELIDNLKSRLANIENKIDNHRFSYLDFRLKIVHDKASNIRKDIDQISTLIQNAQNEATHLSQKCLNISNHVSNIYKSPPDINKYKSAGGLIYQLNHAPLLESMRNPGFNVWYQARQVLGRFGELVSFNEYKHNALAHLFLTSNTQFLESIGQDKLAIQGEIGYLIIQRLKEIYYDPQSTGSMRNNAGNMMSRLMPLTNPESLLSYDEQSLTLEITKLILHAKLHPDEKIIWLGTARAVDATIKQPPGRGMYLNPINKNFSWGLNRAWLQVAAHLGYTFQLIEQHFPKIESALLSQDAAKFIEQLLMEMRAPGSNNTSQYNGDYSPTATPQEILVLLDMGCTAHKNSSDQRIILKAPTYREDLTSKEQNKIGIFCKRTHSCPAFDEASAPPAYNKKSENFINPETGELVKFSNTAGPGSELRISDNYLRAR